jgi:hypothetical protein
MVLIFRNWRTPLSFLLCPKKAQHRKEVIIRSKFTRPPVRADPVADNLSD